MKNKTGIAVTNASQKILDESECKPNKIWVDKGSEFYNKWNHGYKIIIIQKFILQIMKENLLLLKDFIRTLNLQIHDFNIKKCFYW